MRPLKIYIHYIMKLLGYRLTCDDFEYENKRNLVIVSYDYENEWYKFAMCPKKCMDRWSNSQHITWICYPTWGAKKFGKHLMKNMKDAQMFARFVPRRFFDKFITIDL